MARKVRADQLETGMMIWHRTHGWVRVSSTNPYGDIADPWVQVWYRYGQRDERTGRQGGAQMRRRAHTLVKIQG